MKRHKKDKDELGKSERVYVEGNLSVSSGGFGFVSPKSGGTDIFIPPRYLGNAIDGDLVKVSLLINQPARYASKGAAGIIVDVLGRKRKSVVGELLAGKKVRPLAKNLHRDICVEGSLGNAKKGDWVEILLDSTDKKHGEVWHGRLESSIGKAGTAESDIDAVIREYSLCPPYTSGEREESLRISQIKVPREDLTNLFCVTIDPPDAKDFDDAISVSHGKNEDEIEIGVHIADVASWISKDSLWDLKAAERAFTSYIPGRTLPMLPQELTKLISLTPGKISFCNSVLITVEKKSGKIIGSRRVYSTIDVAKRLTFDEVQEFIDGRTPPSWSAKLAKNVGLLAAVAKKMREFRKNHEHFLELATTEVRVLCDENTGEISGLKTEVQTESDEIVEECMLAANVEVAKELLNRGIPGIFRVHPEPAEEKLLEFSVFMEETFGVASGDLSSRKACNHFLSKLPDDHKKAVIIDAFLRSLPRASYHEKNALHFGLGKGAYCHFTSPIRRYPDLVVHQQLWAADFAGKMRPKKETANIAEVCSEKEERNDEAYYAANDRLKLHYLKKRLFDAKLGCFEGIIRRITNSGMFVNIPEVGIMAFVPVEYLGGTFRKKSGKLVSSGTHSKYKCGDFIYLQPEKIDLIRGTAFFSPVSY